MQKWWDTIQAAWAMLIIGLGGGGVFAYLTPQIGIPICIVLIVIGICLLIRAYKKRGKQDSTVQGMEHINIVNHFTDILTKLHERDLKLKDKCVKQYATLFDGKDFRLFLDLFANAQNGYTEVSSNIKKDIGKKKLSKDIVKKRQQIDGLTEKVMSSTIIAKDWTFAEIIKVGNLIDKLPNEQNPKYRGIRSLRKTDKKWNNLFKNLNEMKAKYSNIFSDKELSVAVNDYLEWSFGGHSVLILVDLLDKFVLGYLPTEYISSGTYAPYEKMENRMTELLQDIEKRIGMLDKIQPIIAEPEINIDIDKCSVSHYGQSDQAIEVALTLSVKTPPVNITDVQLYMGDEILQLLSPAMPITQRGNKECYIAKYKLSLTTIYEVDKDKRDKYLICVVAMGQNFFSKVFSINNP